MFLVFQIKLVIEIIIIHEGIDTNEMYLNGFSSSLPLQVQIDALHRVEGLEHAFVMRPGYAIEYDYFDPTQLTHTLETKLVRNLFFAGQINGNTRLILRRKNHRTRMARIPPIKANLTICEMLLLIWSAELDWTTSCIS